MKSNKSVKVDRRNKHVCTSKLQQAPESFTLRPLSFLEAVSFRSIEDARAYAAKHFPQLACDVVKHPAHLFAFVKRPDGLLEMV